MVEAVFDVVYIYVCTQIGGLTSRLGQPFSAQVLSSVPRGGTVGRGGVQHEALATRSADDAWGEEDVQHCLKQKQHLRLLQMRTI